MWSGDSLSVLFFLFGTSLAAMMAAITAPSGWRSKTLWTICVAFGAAGVAWLVAPTASPLIATIRLIAGALVESNALAMLVIVGIVCLVVGGRQSAQSGVDFADIDPGPSRPAFAANTVAKWKPDIPFQQGIGYLGAKSVWPVGKMYSPSVKDAIDELTNALGDSQITAWGKAHPDDEDYHQIDSRFWISVKVTADTNYAFSENRSVAAYDIRLSLEEMKLIWPPREQASPA